MTEAEEKVLQLTENLEKPIRSLANCFDEFQRGRIFVMIENDFKKLKGYINREVVD